MPMPVCRSVVVSALQELDSVGLDQVDAAMFLRDAPRPDICAKILQRLWFTDAVKRVPQNCLDQVQQPLGGAAVRLNPMLQVFQELRVADGEAIAI
jgi:hypothetical protein